MAHAEHICPQCEKEGYTPEDCLTEEQMDTVMTMVMEVSTNMTPYDEEVTDMKEEITIHRELERRLQMYDWWLGNREQVQEIWYNLRYTLMGVNRYQASAQRYFELEYMMAYHRDNCCF